MRLAFAIVLLASPAFAGVDEVVDRLALPGLDRFAATTADLAHLAGDDCRPEALRTKWNAAFDAWLAVADFRMGPSEEGGLGQSIAFWPDTRDATARGLAALTSDGADLSPEAVARASVAGRGLFALERMLYEDPHCDATRALADDLAASAARLRDGWRDGYADALRNAGEPGGAVFFSEDEAVAALYTALRTGLQFVETERLGLPMGEFDAPRPRRAEAWRSGRSQRDVVLSLTALRDLAGTLADAPLTVTAIDRAIASAQALDDPDFAGVDDTAGRFRLEALQQQVATASRIARDEIGTGLALTDGFNSLDGD